MSTARTAPIDMNADYVRLKRCLIEDELELLARKTSDAMVRLRTIQEQCAHQQTIKVTATRSSCLVCGKDFSDD